jgi:hypothetical protein
MPSKKFQVDENFPEEHKLLIDITTEEPGIRKKPQKNIKSILKVLTVPQKIEEKKLKKAMAPSTKKDVKLEYDHHGALKDDPKLKGVTRYLNNSTLRGRANVAKLTLGCAFALIAYKLAKSDK